MMTALASILAVTAFLTCTSIFAANAMALRAHRVRVAVSKR